MTDPSTILSSDVDYCPATGHLDTGFSWFPCVYMQMLRWFPRLQVATTCFSCSPPDFNLVVTNFKFCIHVKYPLPQGDNPIAVNKHYYYYYYYYYYYNGCCKKLLRSPFSFAPFFGGFAYKKFRVSLYVFTTQLCWHPIFTH